MRVPPGELNKNNISRNNIILIFSLLLKPTRPRAQLRVCRPHHAFLWVEAAGALSRAILAVDRAKCSGQNPRDDLGVKTIPEASRPAVPIALEDTHGKDSCWIVTLCLNWGSGEQWNSEPT